jgi:hypothetical protein
MQVIQVKFPYFQKFNSGAAGKNRTYDLFITNEVHYHCATAATVTKIRNLGLSMSHYI